jgi:large repetitive protein
MPRLARSAAVLVSIFVLLGAAAAADPGSSSPQSFIPLGSVATFLADDGVNGLSLFVSDGTAAGTRRLAYPCTEPCYPNLFGLFGDSYFFTAADGDSAALWVTHGTAATTRKLVSNFSSDLFGSNVNVGSIGFPALGLLYFVATTGSALGPYPLWRSDGTRAGTFPLGTFTNAGFGPTDLFELNGEVYFGGDDGSGPALWKSDGTVAGTRIVAPFPPPPNVFGPGPYPVGVAGNELVLGSYTAAHGYELYSSNGTTAGTRALPQLVPGPASPQFDDFLSLGDSLLLAVDDGHSQNIWVVTGGSLKKLTNFKGRGVFSIYYVFLPVTLGRLAFFSADDGTHGSELWETDGTVAGTRMVKDICAGSCSSGPYGDQIAGGKLLFSADDGLHGDELWATDGTANGTRMIADVCPGTCTSGPITLTEIGQRTFFLGAAPSPVGGYQLWRTTGTAASTVRLTDFQDPSFELTTDSAAVDGVLLFQGTDPIHGVEPWVSDGTRTGTHLLVDINTTESSDGAAPAPAASAAAAKHRMVVVRRPSGVVEVRTSASATGSQ